MKNRELSMGRVRVWGVCRRCERVWSGRAMHGTRIMRAGDGIRRTAAAALLPIPDYFPSSRKKGPGINPGPFSRERVTGIEPALSAWEADVLPLNYTRGTRRLCHWTGRHPGTGTVAQGHGLGAPTNHQQGTAVLHPSKSGAVRISSTSADVPHAGCACAKEVAHVGPLVSRGSPPKSAITATPMPDEG